MPGLLLALCLAGAATAGARETHPVPRPDALGGAAAAPAPLPPFIAAPLPPKRSLVPLLVHPWLPDAGGLADPRLLPADRQGRVPLRPTADLPEVAVTPSLLRLLSTGSPAFAAAPDAAGLLGLKLGTDAAPSLSPRIAAVPAANPVDGPRQLPTEGQQAVRLRPAGDSPPLDQVSDPFSPRPPRMQTRPLAFSSNPDIAEAPMLSAAFLPKPDRPSAVSDATWGHSHQAAIARDVGGELIRPPAPFLRLTIPDPFEIIALVQLRHPVPDDDPPSQAPGLPDRPTLPVEP